MFKRYCDTKSNDLMHLDYKKPIPPQNDMRTSYHIGHRQIFDTSVKFPRRKSGDTKMSLDKKEMQFNNNTETKIAYTWKYAEPSRRMATISLEKRKGIKSFDESYMRNVPRPINQTLTTYKKDYIKKSPTPFKNPVRQEAGLASKFRHPTYTIDAQKPGYSRYLDMMATSNMLDYVLFSKEQLSTLAAQDGITVWNWNDMEKPNILKELHPAHISTFAKSKDVVPSMDSPPIRTFPTLTKAVPNGGLTSEFKDKFRGINDCPKFEVNLNNLTKITEPVRYVGVKTEYSMYGSGNKIQHTSVFAKKEIQERTKFGPFEGEMHLSSEVISDVLLIQASTMYPLLLFDETSILDVADENSSNWMRFVRMAQTYSEQNLLLFESSGKLFFKCCKVIYPKEELKVGYSEKYAQHYGLKMIVPTEEEVQQSYKRENPWPCYECDLRFASSNDLQNHLSVHEIDDETAFDSKPKPTRKKRKLARHVLDIRKNSSRCVYCNKVFMTSVSLKKHMTTHLAERRFVGIRNGNLDSTNRCFRCTVCYKKLASEEKLKAHRLVHIKNETKPYHCSECHQCCSTPAALAAHIKSHSDRHFSCVYCSENFKHVLVYKQHVATHSVNGFYPCLSCKKKYHEYHLVRKHIRIFHPAVKFSCNECDRQFLNMAFLRRHKVCHSDKCDFLCSQCGKQFKRKDKLREHIQRIHSENRKQRVSKKKETPTVFEEYVNDGSQFLELSPKKAKEPKTNSIQSDDYQRFIYKCNDCMLGFKRRGMLVNHMAKRHPNVCIESIPELNLPILKPQSLFFCQYCSKVYKSNSKRKLHILKNHPGQELPPSARTTSEPSEINAQTIGSVKTEPHRCQWCYKQYASRNRLVLHHRKEHPDMDSKIPPQFTDYDEPPPMDVYRPPCSPENKLLKLSSAALELSSIEDRKFFDFLNEKSQCSLQEQSSLEESHSHDNGFSKVGVNFKVVEEFGETSSNELNRLPQLFEESISCI